MICKFAYRRSSVKNSVGFFFSFYDFCNVVEQSANIGHLIFVFVNEFNYLVRVQI